MRRIVLVFLIIAFCGAQPALAQDSGSASVSLRTGDHEEYSRLVLEWPNVVNYTLNRTNDGRIVITFKGPGAVVESNISSLARRNIADLKIENQNPLTLSLRVPADSNVRDFYAGNRLVVDVYDSASGPVTAAKREPPPKPEKNAETAPAKQNPPETAKTATPAPDPSELKAPVAAQTPLERTIAEVQKELTTNHMPPESDAVKKARKTVKNIGNNLVTISSTTTMNFAAFRRGDEIWMVNDRPDLVLSPQVSGPQADVIAPVETQKLEGGTLYRAHDLFGSHLKTQGGGLVWRVVISDQPDPDAAVLPVRQDRDVPDGQGRKIVWPFKGKTNMVTVPDPQTGRDIVVITVEDGKQFAGPAMEFIDFDTLYSAAGLAIVPKVDDLDVALTKAGVEVSRPSGLNVLAQGKIDQARARKSEKKKVTTGVEDPNQSYIFNFESWAMGGPESLEQNKGIIMASMGGQDESKKIQGIITLAKMYLANAQWAETQGVLRVAAQSMPDLERNPEFMAMHGASMALGYDSEGAFEILSNETLKPYEEINYWRAAVLADLGDWQQAAKVLPKSFKTLSRYTDPLINRLGLVLAEVALRDGNVDAGNEILDMVAQNKETLLAEQQAALQYLQGEAARQKGDTKKTMELWEPLTTGKDDLYRAKTGLALTRLLVNEKKIDNAKATDQLERLRYAWRGDELEAQINYWLGKTYLENKEFVKGLGIMRDGATFAAGTVLGGRIASEMTEIFTNLFLGPDLEKLSPVDAATLNEEFSELMPTGEKGNQVTERLAEHLVQADLLDRAAALLQRQVDHRLTGDEAYRTAVRLTEIYLLDDQASKAAKSLQKAKSLIGQLPAEAQTLQRRQDLQLLEARTLSQQGRSDRALEMLNDMELTPSVNLLRAGIAWKAQYWDDAAEALSDVILDKNISLTRPLSKDHAMLILQRAVALNLASDRIGLANLREKYSDAMAQTEKARIFEVITRPRQSAALADRETLMSIVSEVDLFADFLKTYRAEQAPSASTAPAGTPPAQAPVN